MAHDIAYDEYDDEWENEHSKEQKRASKKANQINKKRKMKNEDVPARTNIKKQKAKKIKERDIKRMMRDY